jgi:cell division protein FtsL
MNRRRHESRSSGFPIIALLLGAAIIAAGGVLHVYYKNCQIKITREIDAIDRRVEHDRLDISTTRMRMDELLNRYAICKQLKENGSTLRPISVAIVEEIDPAPPNRRTVASAAP